MISDVALENKEHTTVDLANLAFDLRTEAILFEISHRPGYQLKARFGMNKGSVLRGIVRPSTAKLALSGEALDLAWLLEETGDPLKIQARLPLQLAH